MVSLLDKEIPFKCAECGHEVRQSIRWMKTHDRIVCPGCGTGIKLDSGNLIRGAEEAQSLLDGLAKKITIKL
jgi:DNA-directed RNA polymerase subunit RPC12/RpoP